MSKRTLAALFAALMIGLFAWSAAEAQWTYIGNNQWMYIGPQMIPGGLPTVTRFDAYTGAVYYDADYGLTRAGLPPVVFRNQTGGITVLRSMKLR